MSLRNKDESLKEKLRQALTSTFKVISDDYEKKDNTENNKNIKKFEIFEIDNLNSKTDFIKARAEVDSLALKKKFSDKEIYRQNLPVNSSCKSLYLIAEKIRYESLGRKMLKGINKNLNDNYFQILNSKNREQLKTREDVTVDEAFELYMLKKFNDIKLNPLTEKMLSFWEKDFDKSINKNLKYLKENLENQYKYSQKFSEIFKEMDIFQNEQDNEQKENKDDDSVNNPSNENQDSNTDDNKDQNQDEQTDSNLDSDYEVSDYRLDEQVIDSDSDNKTNEEIIQKSSKPSLNLDYKIFTNQYDETIKAENLENSDDANKLRKTLDQQLVGFQDIITKLANKLQRQLLAKQSRAWEFDLEEGLLDSS